MPRLLDRFNPPPDFKDVLDSFLLIPPNPPEFLKFYFELDAEGLLALNDPYVP